FVVEDQALPLRVETLARVRVLIEAGAIEAREPMRVVRKMGGHPIENHADAALMKDINEVHEVLRSAIARAGRKVARGLVTPRAIKRMFGDRQELDVREALLHDIVGEPWRDIPIRRKARRILAPPRPDMQFVNRDGSVERVA